AAPIDLLLVSVGALADRALAAAAELARTQPALNIVVLDPVRALPLTASLCELAASAHAVATLEDGLAERGVGAAPAVALARARGQLPARAHAGATLEHGLAERGIGAALAVALAQRATLSAPAPAMRVLGVGQEFIPHAKRDAILAAQGLDAAGITASLRELLD